MLLRNRRPPKSRVSHEIPERSPQSSADKCRKHASWKIRPSKRLELYFSLNMDFILGVFSRKVFTFRGSFASHDSNPYPNRKSHRAMQATKSATIELLKMAKEKCERSIFRVISCFQGQPAAPAYELLQVFQPGANGTRTMSTIGWSGSWLFLFSPPLFSWLLLGQEDLGWKQTVRGANVKRELLENVSSHRSWDSVALQLLWFTACSQESHQSAQLPCQCHNCSNCCERLWS